MHGWHILDFLADYQDHFASKSKVNVLDNTSRTLKLYWWQQTTQFTNVVLLYWTGSGDSEAPDQFDQWSLDGRLVTSEEVVWHWGFEALIQSQEHYHIYHVPQVQIVHQFLRIGDLKVTDLPSKWLLSPGVVTYYRWLFRNTNHDHPCVGPAVCTLQPTPPKPYPLVRVEFRRAGLVKLSKTVASLAAITS